MTIDDLPPITPDPVIEAYKKDVDRTLLRENLRRTPAERSQMMASLVSQMWEMRQSMIRSRRRRAGDAARTAAG